MVTFIERILILAKTYPSPSAKYVETSCVAGINEERRLRRLYPVPFRLIEEGKQFKKWQWITARIRKSNDDHRPESHRIYVDTIECDAEPLSTKNHWEARWPWIDKLAVFTNFIEVENRRLATNESLALLRPKRILSLEIRPARHTGWTDEEKAKLLQEQMQGSLFGQAEAEQQVRELKKSLSTFTITTSAIRPPAKSNSNTKSSIGKPEPCTGTAVRAMAIIGSSHSARSWKRNY